MNTYITLYKIVVSIIKKQNLIGINEVKNYLELSYKDKDINNFIEKIFSSNTNTIAKLLDYLIKIIPNEKDILIKGISTTKNIQYFSDEEIKSYSKNYDNLYDEGFKIAYLNSLEYDEDDNEDVSKYSFNNRMNELMIITGKSEGNIFYYDYKTKGNFDKEDYSNLKHNEIIKKLEYNSVTFYDDKSYKISNLDYDILRKFYESKNGRVEVLSEAEKKTKLDAFKKTRQRLYKKINNKIKIKKCRGSNYYTLELRDIKGT